VLTRVVVEAVRQPGRTAINGGDTALIDDL
jgi:hypothetical protein